MDTVHTSEKLPGIPDFLSGGGEMGKLIREYDWAQTELGPANSWPQNLRTCIRIMLTSRQPIWIGWGKNLLKFYNDPYKAIAGGKHPKALGMPAELVWQDIWREIGPMLKQVMEKDQGTYVESQLLIMERNGYPEETYYTFSYTPIPGDDGTTAGMICANSDDTDRIISERQLKTMTQLGKRLTDAKADNEVITETIATLKENKYDFPFALFYTVHNGKALLTSSSDFGDSAAAIPREIPIDDSGRLSALLSVGAATKKLQVIDDLKNIIGDLPKGVWEIAPEKAILMPISLAVTKDPHCFLIMGCNPYRLLDEKYRSFFSLVGDQIATSFANVHAILEERRRTEALAEVDKAKTIFFSNISHEFRTPLTLLLGPIEDAINNPGDAAENKIRLEIAHRNALRMQKLVNTLLDFSKIEANRLEGRFIPVDICNITEDLTSIFRSAIEKAGMALQFVCNNVTEPVYLDVDMWEKIILNLLSNAFKYSREGTITVAVARQNNQVNVTITDTGIGIPGEHLDKIFNRFHRIENMEGRSKEGTGIGLSMVKELVKLHCGTISVTSTPGVGSTFTISLPLGTAHLPADKIRENDGSEFKSIHSKSYLEETKNWITVKNETGLGVKEETEDMEDEKHNTTNRRQFSVLLADDNADMRDYVRRLLSTQFNVETAINGQDAYNKIQNNKPDLVLSDVMMPVLDGFGLLKQLRNHPETKHIPVILLSARAGEEAKVEGLDAGADDYLVKPFSSKEIIARVDANIRIAKTRIASENNLKNIIMQAPVAMTILRGEKLVIEMANENALELWGKKHKDVINRPIFDAFPELVPQGFGKILDSVLAGNTYVANEMYLNLIRQGKPEMIYINFIYEPLRNESGAVEGIVGVGIEVTAQVIARKKIQEAEDKARLAIESADLGTYEIDLLTDKMETSARFDQIWGNSHLTSRAEYSSRIHPGDRELRKAAHHESLKTGQIHYEARVIWKDSSVHWVRVKGKVLYDVNKVPYSLIGVIQDITEQKLFAEQLKMQVQERTLELQRSNEDLQQFAHVASHDLKEPVRKIKTFSNRLIDEYGDNIPGQGQVFLQKIQNATNRMISMIDGVLNYSTINSAEQSIETIDLNDLFRSIEMDLENVILQKNAVVKRDVLNSVQGAPVLIYQLFYNLINNSLKFINPGAVPEIMISSTRENLNRAEYVKITITDNGIGFEQEYAEKIFSTFTRLNTKDKYEGTGIGLALCKKIVDRHRGFISASGVTNVGAVFTIYLPLYQSNKSI